MFVLPNQGEHEPAEIYGRLLERDAHFSLLREWKPLVAFLLRTIPERSQQRSILGTCSMPMVQGRHRKLFSWLIEEKLGYLPVFLFTLDADWWDQANPRQREILMFHEMSHASVQLDSFGEQKFHRETGEPVWAIKGHDVEEFTDVAERYGAWGPELEAFKQALNSHGQP